MRKECLLVADGAILLSFLAECWGVVRCSVPVRLEQSQRWSKASGDTAADVACTLKSVVPLAGRHTDLAHLSLHSFP